jgi:hypothetical protein
MSRTTLDIDPSILYELKQRQLVEHKSLGRLVSELLAQALTIKTAPKSSTLEWISRPMKARIDLEDKEALFTALGEQ